jgi:L-lactate dehydrogenase complex protein LldG
MPHESDNIHITTPYQQFNAALTLVGGVGHLVDSAAQAATIVAELVDASTNLNQTIWTAPLVRDAMPTLIAALKSQGCDIRYPDSPADVRDQPFGLSFAEGAVAETGSVVLVERDLNDRSVGLMTETHIVVCREDALVGSLDDAALTLAEVAKQHGSYATLVTGPSRTADIERQLTIGVQGPSQLHVIMIADQPNTIQGMP